MIKGGRREETSKFAALSGCTYNDIGLKYIVCHPARDITETVIVINIFINTFQIKLFYFIIIFHIYI